MEEEEKVYRQKVLKIGAVSIAICLLIAYWYATQGVVADCIYSELLGVCLSIVYFWQQDENLKKAIPQIIGSYAAFPYLGFVLGASFTYIYAKNMKQEISHGSAAFATAKEIDETGLGNYEDKISVEEQKIWGISYKKKVRKVKTSGVVIGVKPYNKHLMLHDGVEHILLIAPTRSGKGVNTIIPTGLICNDVFVYEGGNDVITDYTTGQNTIKLATGTIINSSLKSSDIILNTANGSITVKNGKDKKNNRYGRQRQYNNRNLWNIQL